MRCNTGSSGSCITEWATLSSIGELTRGRARMAQIAELDTVPETIEATLNYFVNTGAVPVTLVGGPGAVASRADRRDREQTHPLHAFSWP